MAKAELTPVSEYIAAQPQAVRAVLTRVRNAIRRALPEASETISYKIPAYKLDGKAVLYFAAWKRHYSLYPASRRLIAAFEKELAVHEIEKSTIRFALSEPVPVNLIARIAEFRAKEASDFFKIKYLTIKSTSAKLDSCASH